MVPTSAAAILKIFQRQLEQADHFVECSIIDIQMGVRVSQHGLGIAFGSAHDRRYEFGLMLDQALHVGVRKERGQSGGSEDAVIKAQHDARDKRQAAVAFEHRLVDR